MLSQTEEEIITKLLKFFIGGSLNFNIKPEEIQQFIWNKQKLFMDKTVNSPSFLKYPPNSNFCRLFFKKLITFLEPYQEVHDDMYAFLCSEMNKNSENEFYYRRFVVGNDLENCPIIKETKSMVINGTTGLKTWEAAFMLTDWALCNKDIFNKKKVLELGCGVGFTGISITKHCDITSMVMTDCHPDVLKTLEDNVDINFYSDPARRNFNNTDKVIEVMKLDWYTVEDFPIYVVPDIIIGADIIYDPMILEPLCNVLNLFVQRNPNTEIYICSIIRNEDTFNTFLKTLETSELTFEKILHTKSVKVEWDQSLAHCFLKITKS